jgi:hypothetical protein
MGRPSKSAGVIRLFFCKAMVRGQSAHTFEGDQLAFHQRIIFLHGRNAKIGNADIELL